MQNFNMGVQLSKNSHLIIFLVVLPLVSIGLTFIFSLFLQVYIGTPWILFIDSLGVLGFYTLLFKLFNDSLWQFIPRGMLGIVDVPNLNGVWNGELKSSYDRSSSYAVTIRVIQTFSNVRIFAYFSQSWSYSIVADFYKESDGRRVLHYIYRNEPRSIASQTMHGHYGASKHEYIEDKNIMECSYYNEPPRQRGSYGKFNVVRKKRTFIQWIFPAYIKSDFK